MTELDLPWTTCPACGCGRGEDHRRGCRRAKNPPVALARGMPLAATRCGEPAEGEHNALRWRWETRAAQRFFEQEQEDRGRYGRPLSVT